MIGAGVFAAWSPAAAAAGTGLAIGLAIAAAGRVLQRHLLGPAGGRVSGVRWHVRLRSSATRAGVGASRRLGIRCRQDGILRAAIALTVGAYLWPAHDRWSRVVAVVVITAINIGGLSRTVAVTRVVLVVSLAALAAVVVAGWSSPDASFDRLTPIDASVLGVLRSAGFLFFAFAGYARIATLGEEVRDPARRFLGRSRWRWAPSWSSTRWWGSPHWPSYPSETWPRAARLCAWWSMPAASTGSCPIVRIGAGIAALGVLLNLIPGISRTSLAMARNRELPHWFAHIHPQRSLPVASRTDHRRGGRHLVAVLDLRSAIGVSGVAC